MECTAVIVCDSNVTGILQEWNFSGKLFWIWSILLIKTFECIGIEFPVNEY